MKITFLDEERCPIIDLELIIPNDQLKTMDDISVAALKIARVFAQAIEKQGLLVPQHKAAKPPGFSDP